MVEGAMLVIELITMMPKKQQESRAKIDYYMCIEYLIPKPTKICIRTIPNKNVNTRLYLIEFVLRTMKMDV